MDFQPLIDFMEGYLPMLGVPGADISIYKDHEEIFRYSAGYENLSRLTRVRPDALYHMYSITKISTAVAATQLIERGDILTTDPVYAYIPEYRDLTVKVTEPDGSVSIRPAATAMTVEHLLTMTSGLSYDVDRDSIKNVVKSTDGRAPTLEIVKALAADPLEFDPGTAYKYSLSLDVLGALIEVASDMSLAEYMQKNIFEPLGMKDTTFGVPDSKRDRLATQYSFDHRLGFPMEVPLTENHLVFGSEYLSGGAGLVSSVDDQILLADALAHYGVGKNGARILSRRGVELMSANHLSPDVLMTFDIPHCRGYGYGYGVRSNIDPASAGNLSPVGEFGWDGMRGSYMHIDPKNGLAAFYAEHLGGMHPLILPRLRNVIYGCLGDLL